MGADSVDAGWGLLHLCQGTRSVSDYSNDFCTQARRSKWNVSALCDAFLHGLADYIKDELVSYELPTTLDEIIGLATWVDHRIQARRQERRQGASGHHALSRPREAATPALSARPAEQPTEGLEPMQVGCSVHGGMPASLLEQSLPLLWPGRPFSCRVSVKSQGSSVSGGVLMSRTPTKHSPTHRSLIHARFLLPGGVHTLACFIDSGADVSIMDEHLVTQLELGRVPLPQPVPVPANTPRKFLL